MADQWQNIVAWVVVMMAAAYLVRRSWRAVVKKRSGGCGACGSCPAGSDTSHAAATNHDPAGKPLVQLQTFAKRQSDR